MRRLLCWLGFHDWRCIEAWKGQYGEHEWVTQNDKWKCLSCGKDMRLYNHPKEKP
jgi:hypothetical protein